MRCVWRVCSAAAETGPAGPGTDFQREEEEIDMTIEILYFEGCPNHEPALESVREHTRYGLTCRRYPGDGAPSMEMIENALRATGEVGS